jgi:hypothetical protein
MKLKLKVFNRNYFYHGLVNNIQHLVVVTVHTVTDLLQNSRHYTANTQPGNEMSQPIDNKK